MGLRAALGLLALFLCAWQPGIAMALTIRGASPDLPLVAIVCVGLLLGPEDGAVTGLLCGVLQAGHTGASGVGALIVSRIGAGLAAGYIGERVFGANLIVPGVCAIGATFVAGAIYFLIAPYPDLIYWVKMTLGRALYNGAVALPTYRVTAYLVRRLSSESAPAF